jgi:hypothetical protein
MMTQASRPAFSSSSSSKSEVAHDKVLCRQRQQIENISGRPNDWRRIVTRFICRWARLKAPVHTSGPLGHLHRSNPRSLVVIHGA